MFHLVIKDIIQIMRSSFMLLLPLLILIGCDNSKEKRIEEVIRIEDGVKKVGQFMNGRLHGDLKEYDSLGNLIYEASYLNGLANGNHTKYAVDGKPKYEVNFEMGKINGRVLHYDKFGQISEYQYYVKDTVKYAKAFDSKGRIVYFFMGVTADSKVLGDSVYVQLSLIHSNIDNIHIKANIYEDQTKSDTVTVTSKEGDNLNVALSTEEFKQDSSVYFEVYESDGELLYAKSEFIIKAENSNLKEYFTELKTKGFTTITKLNIQ